MEKIDERVLLSALRIYGADHQIDKAIEEMAELIKALMDLKHNNGKDKGLVKAVVEEVADVYIMSTQLINIFDAEAVQREIDYKMQRLSQKIIEHNGQESTDHPGG